MKDYTEPQVRPGVITGPLTLILLFARSGAQKIVSQLNTQRSAITKLTLNHNPLGDDGVSHLFNYLCSAPGSRHRIALSEISLNCTELNYGGLQAISDYIRGNEVLRTLWLASVCARCVLFCSNIPYMACFRMHFSRIPRYSRLWRALSMTPDYNFSLSQATTSLAIHLWNTSFPFSARATSMNYILMLSG